MEEADRADGPWEHRLLAANGARFHLAVAGSGRPVVLVHGFPGYWWTWREVLPALAEAGFRAIAVDVRGFGGSDKPPGGYDLGTAVADLAGISRSLGEERAVFVGHGLGAWTVRHLGVFAPAVAAAIALVSPPSPSRLHPYAAPGPHLGVRRYERALQLSPGREPGSGPSLESEVERVLRVGSASTDWITPEVIARHTAAVNQPFVAHARKECFDRLRPGASERRAIRARPTIAVPLLLAHGARDPVVPLPQALGVTSAAVGPIRVEIIPDAGHFVPEEAPGALSRALIDWLGHAD